MEARKNQSLPYIIMRCPKCYSIWKHPAEEDVQSAKIPCPYCGWLYAEPFKIDDIAIMKSRQT